MRPGTPDHLSEEQVMLVEMVRRLGRDLAPLAAGADASDEFPSTAIEKIRAAGLLGLATPPEHGGDGADVTTLALVLEELGYAFPAAAISTMPQLVGADIIHTGGGRRVGHYLDRIGNEGALTAIALTEAEAGSDAANLQCRATVVDGGFLLNGTKLYVTNGSLAEFLIVFVRTGDPGSRARGISAVVVDADTPGLTVDRVEDKMGLRGSSTAQIGFHDAFVPEANLLGNVGDGFRYVMEAFDRSRPLIGAIAVGIAQAALDESVEYAKERKQFGQPIAAFQGIQFLLADMAMATVAARALVHAAAGRASEGAPGFGALAAMAKTVATDAAMQVTTDAIQVFGAAGYMKGMPVERMMRDAKVFQIFEGTNQIQRIIVARDLIGGDR